MRSDQVIIQPVLTEKTNAMREGEMKKYAFHVDSRANKVQIRKAIMDLFSVRPVKCQVMWVKGKPKMTRTKSGFRSGSTTPWKKAIVTLKAGETIEAVEGV